MATASPASAPAETVFVLSPRTGELALEVGLDDGLLLGREDGLDVGLLVAGEECLELLCELF